MICDYQRDFMK